MIKNYGTSAQPWLVKCNGDDKEKYIVKFLNEKKAFANEFVCNKIANEIGLTTTPSFPVTIEQKEVEIINKRKEREKEKLISEGKYFFSKYVENPYTLNQQAHNSLQSTAIKNLDQVPGMIVFDIFVDNSDRSHNNALIHPIDSESAIFEYVLIDHGHCISGPNWTADSLKNIQYKIKSIPWKATEIKSESVFSPYISALKKLDGSFCEKIISEIPSEWKNNSNDFKALIGFLASRDPDLVLKEVLQAKDNKQLFPNWK